jgi:hypothetical protein
MRHLELQLIADGLLQGPLVNFFDPGLLPACPTSLGWQFFHLLALLIIELGDHELLQISSRLPSVIFVREALPLN